jgi:hypothetical protein
LALWQSRILRSDGIEGPVVILRAPSQRRTFYRFLQHSNLAREATCLPDVPCSGSRRTNSDNCLGTIAAAVAAA